MAGVGQRIENTARKTMIIQPHLPLVNSGYGADQARLHQTHM
jgi:hypothetical protein